MPNYTDTATGPASYGFAITPHDSTNLTHPTRSILAAGEGVVKWVNVDGDVQTSTLAAGERVAVKAIRINATGTTATGLEGLA